MESRDLTECKIIFNKLLMGNNRADEVIGLGKSCQVLQSPGLGCDGVVCRHLNYSVMVRSEITRFRI
jgi:hypothetical protein